MSDAAWTKIKDVVDTFISRPSPQPPFFGPVAAITEDGLLGGRAFVPEASYFSVRLVSMRLAEGGKYFVDFLPLGVCVAEYTYGAERRRVPLVLSNETVKQMLGDAGAKPGHVHFTNMPIVRRAPMKHDNLALFVGLFRMPYTDIARSVLQLAADVSQEIGGPALGTGTRVAAKLYDRVADIFSLSTVQPRFAFLDGMALKKSGYLLVSGPLPPDVNVADLVVENGRLQLKRPGTQLPDSFDYCLLAIEQSDSLFSSTEAKAGSGMLGSLAGLPFHERWRTVTSLLAARKIEEAEEALLTLRAEVVASPDLTEEDRLTAIGGYDVAYAQYEQQLAKPAEARPATRGFRSATPVTALKAAAGRWKERGDEATGTAIEAIALRLQTVPAGKRDVPGDNSADEVLAEALLALRPAMAIAHTQGVRAATLANALSVGQAATI